MRDAPFEERPSLPARLVGLLVGLAALPMLVIVAILRIGVLALLPPLLPVLMLLVPTTIAAGVAFGYYGHWNSVAQCAVLCILAAALYWGSSVLVTRCAGPQEALKPIRLR